MIDGGTVAGTVIGLCGAFDFTGSLEKLPVDGPTALIGGVQTDPTDYSDDRPDVLTIVGNGTPSR